MTWNARKSGVLITAALLAAAAFGRSSSRDAAAAYFKANHTSLDRVVFLMSRDTNISIVLRHSKSNGLVLFIDLQEQAISPTNLSDSAVEIAGLLASLKCDYIRRNEQELTICPRRLGIEDLYPGGFKVFAYRAAPPASTVPSIDKFRRANRGVYDVYQPLTGNWFLKYEEAH